MKTKAKGFTVIETIITLAITVVVLGSIYLFFLTSNKTLTSTEINSQLQSEAEIIQNNILRIGDEAVGLTSICSGGIEVLNKKYADFSPSLIDKLTVDSLKFKSGSEEAISYNEVKYEDTKLIINGNILSKHISEFKVRPLDLNMVDSSEGKFSNTTGLEFSIKLIKSRGYSKVEYPLTIIVKFRNK